MCARMTQDLGSLPNAPNPSDEIDRALRENGIRLAARRPLRERVKTVLQPESMTAVATIAAAVAAFLAVMAAVWQERATFASTLFTKQVDVLASAEIKTQVFETMMWKLEVFTVPTPRTNIAQEDARNVYSSVRELETALKTLEFVYPKTASEKIAAANAALHHLEITTALMLTPASNSSRDGRTDYKEIESALREIKGVLGSVEDCSKPYFRQGKHVGDAEFKACLSAQR